MIRQKEIIDKAREWKVPPDTVDKDYILGHILSLMTKYYSDELVFKGGTCLRKCYFDNYRFSEDLDFSSIAPNFILEQEVLENQLTFLQEEIQIPLYVEAVERILSNNSLKAFKVYIKYWGANHSKNKRPLPHTRWQGRVKLEISIDELLIRDTSKREILHPFTDDLCGDTFIFCYNLDEIAAEKIRALVQRSYTAPRDFYDLYYITESYKDSHWRNLKPLVIKKMQHKNMSLASFSRLMEAEKVESVKNAWKASIAHQIHMPDQPSADLMIESVLEDIKKYILK